MTNNDTTGGMSWCGICGTWYYPQTGHVCPVNPLMPYYQQPTYYYDGTLSLILEQLKLILEELRKLNNDTTNNP